MKKKLFEKRSIRGLIPFVLMNFLLSVLFFSCQQDDFLTDGEEQGAVVLKSASIQAFVYPDLFAGPETFAPGKGKLQTQSVTLTNSEYAKFESSFALIVQNGDGSGANVVQGANIFVNGTEILSLADFRKAPLTITREITGLGETTTIDVEVKGKTTGSLTLWIEGTRELDPLPTFTDERDGHVYQMVTIGDQIWMAENLAWLPSVNSVLESSATEARYYVYGYDGNDVSAAKASATYQTFGALYNWTAAQSACPDGWHLPSVAEWEELENYLIANGYNYDGSTEANKLAKALAARTSWYPYPAPGTPGDKMGLNNSSRFGALPGGHKDYTTWMYVTLTGNWWTSTLSGSTGYWDDPEAWVEQINSNEIMSFRRNNGSTYNNGFSIRAVKD